MTTGKCIIFLGPSLPRAEAMQILPAEYRAPAGQGDILRACTDRPCAIGLVDGVFKDTPTVRHREILWALSKGIPVFGAASMGALRAAELCSAGMTGIGLIFRWYRRYALLPDDAVAVTHGPTELGSPGLSDALVDIRRALNAARRQGLISSRAAQAQLAQITALPFAERRMPELAKTARPSQKAEDARALLHVMARHQNTQKWCDPTTDKPPIVHAWLDDLRDSGLELDDV